MKTFLLKIFFKISVPERGHVFRELGRDGRLEGGRPGLDQRVRRSHKAGLSHLGKAKVKKIFIFG